MSGSQTSTHELVPARTSASSTTLDLPFSTQVRELYAKRTVKMLQGDVIDGLTALW
jgi:hypothetical protein